MIPYNKLSKKRKKEINNQKRNFWTVYPVTKIIPDKKKDFKNKYNKED